MIEILNKGKNITGITLIALVITIIVLLILAGVTINILAGEEGILTKAKQAVDLYKGEVAVENTTLDQYEEYIKNRGKEPSPGKPDANGLFTVSNTIDGQATGNMNNPLIPAGFKPLNTDTSNWGDGATAPSTEAVNNGLVIEDKDNNEFVWVPVDPTNFSANFVQRAGYELGGNKQTILAYTEANAAGINSGVTENTEIQNEAKAMYASVQTNGGFYIGRYEAGIDGTTERASGAGITDKVVVKPNKYVYNYVAWSNSTNMSNITGGAVELARNFDTQQGYDTTKINSTLCYGVQWDTALNFMDPGYTGYAKNSTGKGNYAEGLDIGSRKKTGASTSYKVNNIYDMAGNLYEWTMESYNGNKRTYRGGYYFWTATGSDQPASYRGNDTPTLNNDAMGFRITLYLGTSGS